MNKILAALAAFAALFNKGSETTPESFILDFGAATDEERIALMEAIGQVNYITFGLGKMTERLLSPEGFQRELEVARMAAKVINQQPYSLDELDALLSPNYKVN